MLFILVFALFSLNASQEFDTTLARIALEFSAIAYAEDPTACLSKQNATLILKYRKPCDYWGDECWGLISIIDNWIIVSFRGTRTKLQLITELVEAMAEPRKKINAGGAVQHYFYTAIQQIWKPIDQTLCKLKMTYPDRKILFTGHSLGGALASLASTIFAYHHPLIRDKIHLITFGQPRVGNYDYAIVHDSLITKSWRIIHRYDIVAHLPACLVSILTQGCASYHNHASYHHGTEIWFPSNMTDNALYTICRGLPRNEDKHCSNGYYLHLDIRDHIYYFEHNVSEYGRNRCIDPRK